MIHAEKQVYVLHDDKNLFQTTSDWSFITKQVKNIMHNMLDFGECNTFVQWWELMIGIGANENVPSAFRNLFMTVFLLTIF